MLNNKILATIGLVLLTNVVSLAQTKDIAVQLFSSNSLSQTNSNSQDNLIFTQNGNTKNFGISYTAVNKKGRILSGLLGFYFNNSSFYSPNYVPDYMYYTKIKDTYSGLYARFGYGKQFEIADQLLLRTQLCMDISYQYNIHRSDLIESIDTLSKKVVHQTLTTTHHGNRIGLGLGVNMTLQYPIFKSLNVVAGVNIIKSVSFVTDNSSSKYVYYANLGGPVEYTENYTIFGTRGDTYSSLGFFPSIGLSYRF